MTNPLELRKNLEKARSIALGIHSKNITSPEAEYAYCAANMIHDAMEALNDGRDEVAQNMLFVATGILLCSGADRKKMPWFLALTEPAHA